MSKKMIVVIIIFALIAAIVIWFAVPFSPIKKEFRKDVESLINQNKSEEIKIIQKSDFEGFPIAIQKFVENCGYIGTPHKDYLRMYYKNVDFAQGKNGPKLKIDYIQYDLVKEPARLALIDSRLFGIPFEGYDYYENGKGGMKGVIAKTFTLFNQTGNEMDKACLVTYLAECLFVPSALLNGFITFKEINDYQVEATISYRGQTTGGVFTFNERYEYISFTTNDRSITNSDGTFENVRWSAVCGEYVIAENGIKYPSVFKAVWNYPAGDFVYFDGKISGVE